MFLLVAHFRLLVVVRDPVTRAISDYTQAASKRKEMKSFEELAFLNQTTGKEQTFHKEKITIHNHHALCLLSLYNILIFGLFLNTGAVDTTWGPIKIGLYARYLDRWLQYFSLSQFLFVSGEVLIEDPAYVFSSLRFAFISFLIFILKSIFAQALCII